MTDTPSCKPITIVEFEEFASHAAYGNFQQSAGMRRLSMERGRKVDQLGVYEHGELVAATQVAYTRTRFGWLGSIWLGPIGKLDGDVIASLTKGIREAAKRRRAYAVHMWPPLVLQRHESDGTPIGDRHEDIIGMFTSQGWRHRPLETGYGTVVNRWVYVKDLTGIHDGDKLMASFTPRMRTSIRKARSMGVHVREIDSSELATFADIERQTAERRGFKVQGERYFRQFKKAFGDRAHFMLAEIDTKEYLSACRQTVTELDGRIGSLESKQAAHPTSRTARQLKDAKENRKSAQERLEDAVSLRSEGDRIPVASSLFVEHPMEVVYLFSGSVERYRRFYAPALIQYEAMLHLCVERGICRYNFYGITGMFDDPDDEGRGVLEFKQGFSGYVEELAGEFVLPVNHLVCLAHSVCTGTF